MMEPNSEAHEPISAAMLVVRAIDDIDSSDDETRDALLADLLCAAWGTLCAQNQ